MLLNPQRMQQPSVKLNFWKISIRGLQQPLGKAALQMANLSDEYGKANRDLSQTWKTADFEPIGF